MTGLCDAHILGMPVLRRLESEALCRQASNDVRQKDLRQFIATSFLYIPK